MQPDAASLYYQLINPATVRYLLFWRSLLAIEGDARQAGELLFVDVVNNDKRDKFSRKMFLSHEDETSLFMSGHGRIVSKDGCKISTSKDFPQHEQESK